MRARAASWVAGRAMQAQHGGASFSRLFWDWATSIVSANQEIRYDLSTLRSRARQLVRDNAHMAGFVLAVEDNLIGADGILLQAKVANAAGKLNKTTNFAIEESWKEWGFPENASIDGHDSWVDLQRITVRNLAVDGEVFARLRPGANNDFRFAVQLIDPDLLDENFNRPRTSTQNEIIMGVEVDEDGKPLFFHFWPVHPSEFLNRSGKRERIPVPADEIIHLFVRLRPGQRRGVTWFAPILTDVKMLAGYEEAELVAARFHAAKMAAITIPDPEKAAVTNVNTKKPGDSNANVMKVAPGGVWRLQPGEALETFDPTHPNQAFKDFVSTILRGIARALGVSYLTLTGDLTAANYSSMRAGLHPERDRWRLLQRWLSVHFHRRVYNGWLPQALLTQKLETDRRIASELRSVEWHPRGWKWVDPQNDLEAAKLEIQLGLNSRQRLCAERGVDFEDVIDELANEQEYADEADVDISGGEQAEKPEAQPKKLPIGDPPADDEETTERKRALALEVA